MWSFDSLPSSIGRPRPGSHFEEESQSTRQAGAAVSSLWNKGRGGSPPSRSLLRTTDSAVRGCGWVAAKSRRSEAHFRVALSSHELRTGNSVPVSLIYCPFEQKLGGMDTAMKNGVAPRAGKCGAWYIFMGVAVVVGEDNGRASVAGEGGRHW